MNDWIKDLQKYKETEKEEHINNIYNYLSKKINYIPILYIILIKINRGGK